MRADSPVESLASALYSALARDLPDLTYTYRVPGSNKDGKGWKEEKRCRRPHREDVRVYLFEQDWENTSVGLDELYSIAGQAFTSAYTTVVICDRVAAVYFGGTYAYLAKFSKVLMDDIIEYRMARQSMRGKYDI